MLITGQTRVVGLVGGPSQVVRSISPQIHNAAFKQLEMDWTYVTFGVAQDLSLAIKGLFASGVGGLNVTMPHKVAALDAVDEAAPDVKLVGAVNTICLTDGRLVGHNTDGPGFIRYLRDDLGVDISGKRVVVVGAGGAARSVVAAVSGSGAASVAVAARDVSGAHALEATASGCAFSAHPLPVPDDVASAVDLVVNATPLGQNLEPVPIPVHAIGKDATLIDLVYSPADTRLVQEARAAGIAAHGGLGMLLHQAAISFELWTSRRPSFAAMSSAAIRALASGTDT